MKLTCAIIEDEPLAQKILAQYVGQVDELVLAGIAGNISQFREIAAMRPVSVILLDLTLRGSRQEEITSLLKEDYIIILITAYSVKHLTWLDLLRVEAVLNKPVSFKQFTLYIHKLLKRLEQLQ